MALSEEYEEVRAQMFEEKEAELEQGQDHTRWSPDQGRPRARQENRFLYPPGNGCSERIDNQIASLGERSGQ